MSDEPEISAELTAQERALAEQLDAARQVPAPGFRGALGRHLVAQDLGYGPRPRHLRLIAFACLVGAALLLILAALQSIGKL